MSKLTRQIAVHISDEDDLILKGLAGREGKSPSEYSREILIQHIQSIRLEYESMRSLFEREGSVRSDSTKGTDRQ